MGGGGEKKRSEYLFSASTGVSHVNSFHLHNLSREGIIIFNLQKGSLS